MSQPQETTRKGTQATGLNPAPQTPGPASTSPSPAFSPSALVFPPGDLDDLIFFDCIIKHHSER